MAQAKSAYYDAATEHKPFPKRGAGGQLTEDGPKRHPNKGRKAPVTAQEA
uniref:Multidrug transporter n=3 Tax=unclassified bacterial viruses TaxID=12333 RepID=A0AAU6W0A1_9VIRU